jgi:hypothetical protein
VNAGAITTSISCPRRRRGKWNDILNVYGAFAGRRLALSDEIYRTSIEANTHDRALVNLLKNYDVIKGDPMEALDIYTRACSVGVSARDLATMGATLANGGRNPLTRHQVVSAETARHAVALMATAGLFETTGEWIYRVGVPAKSGAGGGIVAVVPGKFAIGVFSPPLDEAGNSVRGGKAIDLIVRRLGANLFASRPANPSHAAAAGKPTATTAAAEARAGKPAPLAPAASRGLQSAAALASSGIRCWTWGWRRDGGRGRLLSSSRRASIHLALGVRQRRLYLARRPGLLFCARLALASAWASRTFCWALAFAASRSFSASAARFSDAARSVSRPAIRPRTDPSCACAHCLRSGLSSVCAMKVRNISTSLSDELTRMSR